jgi:hypothetical protein
MKKILLIALAAVFAVGVGTAYARGYGMGYGNGNNSNCYGYNNAKGAGMGYGMYAGSYGTGMQGQGNRLPADFQPVTQEKANDIAADYIADNLKGYDVISSGTFQGRRYTGYTYIVQDSEGNQFNIMVNARGNVLGPFPVKK